MKFLIVAGFAESLIGFRKPLIQKLVDNQLTVHVVAPALNNNSPIALELASLGVTTHSISLVRTGMNPLADVRTLLDLYLLIHELKPQFILSYTVKPVIYGTFAAWLARVPNRFTLITGLGFAFINESDRPRSKIKSLVQSLYRIALKRSHMVFFQNPDDETLFRQLKILKSSSISCLVNGSGVDLEQFKVAPLSLDSSPRFLLIARLLGDKGVREYVQAAHQVKQCYPEIQFDLAGWIDTNPNTITQYELDSWIADGRINFLGRLNDVRPAISNCSVYVLPSYREGTPRTVLEAMSMGRAIITTDAPGCRETVIDNDNGFLVPVKSVEALVIAMKKLIENPDLIKIMGQRSREIAEEKYDVHKVNDSMLKAMGISESTNRYA